MSKVVIFLLLLSSCPLESFCQKGNLKPELLAWYKQTLPFFQDIVTGPQYADAPQSYQGSPFYGSREIGNGQIWINGLGYDNIPLLYDVWLDDVLTIHPRYNQKVIIKAEKIDKFALSDGTLFLRYASNSGYGKHNHGFYQVIFEGEPMLLKKNYRTIDSVNEIGLITRKFSESQDYFFWYKGEFWRIGSKSDAATGLGISGKEVTGRFKGKGIVFKKNPEAYLLELIQFRGEAGGDFRGFPAR